MRRIYLDLKWYNALNKIEAAPEFRLPKEKYDPDKIPMEKWDIDPEFGYDLQSIDYDKAKKYFQKVYDDELAEYRRIKETGLHNPEYIGPETEALGLKPNTIEKNKWHYQQGQEIKLLEHKMKFSKRFADTMIWLECEAKEILPEDRHMVGWFWWRAYVNQVVDQRYWTIFMKLRLAHGRILTRDYMDACLWLVTYVDFMFAVSYWFCAVLFVYWVGIEHGFLGLNEPRR